MARSSGNRGITIRFVTVVLSLVVAAAMAVLLVFFVAYLNRRAVEGARQARRRRPGVSWHAGRWDTDPRHAYVANVGDDAAYEVSVTACDRVIGRASSVPPYRAGRLSSSSEPPCYMIFCVDDRIKRRISVGADRATRSAQAKSVGSDRHEVVVRVSWRSEDGERFTQTVCTD